MPVFYPCQTWETKPAVFQRMAPNIANSGRNLGNRRPQAHWRPCIAKKVPCTLGNPETSMMFSIPDLTILVGPADPVEQGPCMSTSVQIAPIVHANIFHINIVDLDARQQELQNGWWAIAGITGQSEKTQSYYVGTAYVPPIENAQDMFGRGQGCNTRCWAVLPPTVLEHALERHILQNLDARLHPCCLRANRYPLGFSFFGLLQFWDARAKWLCEGGMRSCDLTHWHTLGIWFVKISSGR